MTSGSNGHGGGDRDDGGRVGRIATVVTSPALLDELLAALAHRRRRYVLYLLRDRETSDLDELAEYVAAVEGDVPVEAVEDEERDRIKTALAHSHVPRLDEAGLVDYDPRTGAVRYAHPPSLLEPILGIVSDVEAPETEE